MLTAKHTFMLRHLPPEPSIPATPQCSLSLYSDCHTNHDHAFGMRLQEALFVLVLPKSTPNVHPDAYHGRIEIHLSMPGQA